MLNIETIALIIALYGAVLSTFLAFRETAKERKRILVVLQYNEWSAQYSVICTNIGHRPITIVNISIQLPHENVPRDVIREINNPFPKTLNDGDHFSMILPLNLSGYMYNAKKKIALELYDSEGNQYNKFKRIRHDEKYGRYYKDSLK